MRSCKAAVAWLLLLAAPCSLLAQAKSGQGHSLKSARSFVQSFYDWYVLIALKDNSVPAATIALKQRPGDFSAVLFRALKEDSEAQAKANEIVGIDFDPFLSSQDPCERYEVGRVAERGGTYRAYVYGICSGRRNAKPDVIADVVPHGDSYVFVNFHYPTVGRNLLSVLKTLREERRKPPRSP